MASSALLGFSFSLGAVSTVLFMLAFSAAISAFVLSNALLDFVFRRCSSSSSLSSCRAAGAATAGFGASGGGCAMGDADLCLFSTFFFLGSGAAGMGVSFKSLGSSTAVATNLGFAFAFFTTGAASSSPSSPPKLSTFFPNGFFLFFTSFPLLSSLAVLGASFTLASIPSKGLTRISEPVTLVGYIGRSEPSSSVISTSAIFIKL